MHSLHYYNPPQLGSISDILYNRHKYKVRLKTTEVLTELTFWMGDNKQVCATAEALAAIYANVVSWIDWAGENSYNGGTDKPYPELEKHCSHVYPAAVAKTLTSFGFDDSSGVFKLIFRSDPSIGAPSEVILPASKFANGYNVQIVPTGSLLQYKSDKRTFALFTSSPLKKGIDISVTITSKQLSSGPKVS